ncbi:MAG: hypothetical protein A2542_04035 [Parcubacteria group bacterium RIFOXYD2_FULL_52_8]|nr:MAG: hypothetical protein A2542_04035 [Parcubacteria group bacterium RIFOXYD2_FULL_52_8]
MSTTKHNTQNSKEPGIIYEDVGLLVLNKPAGLLMHAHIGSSESTLVDWLLENYPETKNVGEGVGEGTGKYMRAGLVHRLDRETSGVVLVAKTQAAYQVLKGQFSAGSAEQGYDKRPKKVYQAIVYGTVKEEQGMINRPIGRSRGNPKLRTVGAKATGIAREALTYYKVLERFRLTPDESYTFLEAYPKTGRTHQVRVHLGSLGKPVVCDALYAPGKVCPLGLGRHALHAASIEVVVPGGARKCFAAPLPADMARALEELRKIC